MGINLRESWTPVEPYRVTLACKVPGCRGEMEATDLSATVPYKDYRHRCTTCGASEFVSGKKYPMVAHRSEPERGAFFTNIRETWRALFH